MEYQRPSSLKPTSSGFCPGCMHSLATKLIADVLDDMGQQENSVHVVPVGCATLNLAYWKGDLVGAAHGRAPAVATGFKRTNPDRLVFAYQGDGDCAAIGLAEIMGAANRGENFTVIFFNNQTYGMTGGQMAPTTLIGQKTTTTRDDVTVVRVPADDIAVELGNIKCANIILIGALIGAEAGIITEEAMLASLDKKFASKKKEVLALNHAALKKGVEYGKQALKA